MHSYLKCVYANKFCFVGMAGFLPSLIGSFTTWGYLDHPDPLYKLAPLLSIMTACTCYMLIGATGFGAETYRAYRRTKEHIQRFGRLDDAFRFRTYCSRTGFHLAIREAGIKV